MIKFLLNLIVYPLSFLAPRNARVWAFGSPDGSFEGNSKFLYLWTAQNARDIRPIWITGDRALVALLRAHGYEAVLRWSLAGMSAALTAAIHFVTRNGGDTNFPLTGGSRIFNLWHGVGIKNILRGSAVGKNAALFRFRWFTPLYLRSLERFAAPSLVLSTSPTMSRHFARCFAVPLQACIEAGYPRQDPCFNEALRSQALQLSDYGPFDDECRKFDKIYLYAPTLRQDRPGFFDDALPDLVSLSKALSRTRALLWIKLHPGNAALKRDSQSFPDNIRMWPGSLDLYPVLDKIDCLITDYSSMLYDFIDVRSKGVIIYDFDYGAFIREERDLAFPFEDSIVGVRASSFQALCDAVAADAAAQPLNPERLRELRERFWGDRTPLFSACQSIHHHIRATLGLPSMVGAGARI